MKRPPALPKPRAAEQSHTLRNQGSPGTGWQVLNVLPVEAVQASGKEGTSRGWEEGWLRSEVVLQRNEIRNKGGNGADPVRAQFRQLKLT